MAKQEIIKNEFDRETALDIYDKKYLRFLPIARNKIIDDIYNAIKTRDLPTIETSLKPLANIANNAMYILGIVCYIIEKERLYENTEFGWSYLKYAEHLVGELNIPIATLSEAKVLMGIYIEYNRPLMRAGFTLERNASKLRYLPEALENHEEEDVYEKIVDSNYREFRDWAQRKGLSHKVLPGPDIRVNAVIKGNKLLIDGKNILNFPKGVTNNIKTMVANDLARTFSIREGGNVPYIVETYGTGEQTAIANFLKKYRVKK